MLKFIPTFNQFIKFGKPESLHTWEKFENVSAHIDWGPQFASLSLVPPLTRDENVCLCAPILDTFHFF
jgi:hypothetical protein